MSDDKQIFGKLTTGIFKVKNTGRIANFSKILLSTNNILTEKKCYLFLRVHLLPIIRYEYLCYFPTVNVGKVRKLNASK